MGSWHNDAYFFGEDYTMFNKSLHVVVAARLVLFIETLLLLIYVIAVPLTIGFFDTISVFQILVCGSVLICAFLAMYRLEHRLFWPFMIIKGCEVVMYVFLFVIAVLLAAVRRSTILHLIRWRLNTVDHSNETAHIVGVVGFLLVHLLYSTVALQAVYNVFDYYRARAIFIYNQERNKAFQFFFL